MDGELSNVVYELKGEFKAVKESVDKMSEKLDNLPCVTHEAEIKTLMQWKSFHNNLNKQHIAGRYSIWVAVISLIGVIILALVHLLG